MNNNSPRWKRNHPTFVLDEGEFRSDIIQFIKKEYLLHSKGFRAEDVTEYWGRELAIDLSLALFEDLAGYGPTPRVPWRSPGATHGASPPETSDFHLVRKLDSKVIHNSNRG